MRIDGAWWLCDDGIVRPVIRAGVRTAADAWLSIHVLVDVGADRTVFSAGVLEALGIQPEPAKEKLEGVGGRVESVTVATQIRMTRETGATILINGPFAAFTGPKALDMSVLGRDLTNLFAVIVDRPQDVVCLLGGNHRNVVVDK
jgi:hypothetical protein